MKVYESPKSVFFFKEENLYQVRGNKILGVLHGPVRYNSSEDILDIAEDYDIKNKENDLPNLENVIENLKTKQLSRDEPGGIFVAIHKTKGKLLYTEKITKISKRKPEYFENLST